MAIVQNRNVRLIDIATRLELTVNTVSRALRDKSDIGEETKLRVKQTALEMGYIPNTIASSLRRGQSRTIAIVFDNLVNPYFMIMADKIHRKLELIGYAMMIFAGTEGKLEMSTIETIVSRKVDGIITFLEPTNEVMTALSINQIPMVLVGRKNTKLPLDSVATDDFDGAYKVGLHFVAAGAKRIAYLGAPKEIECSRRRLKGLKKALQEHNLEADEKNFIYMNERSVRQEVEVLLSNHVDAIFCFNDMIALEVCELLTRRHIAVPNQVRVAGFDDIQSDFILPIRLTTVASDKEQIIDRTLQLLLDKVEHRNQTDSAPLHIDFEVQLKKGDTV
jgi:LacI family transcriptional regulator